MKQLNKMEKQLIMTVFQNRNADRYLLKDLFGEWLLNRGIAVDVSKGNLLFDTEKYSEADSTLMVQKEIFQAALLVKYLEENHYLYIFADNATAKKTDRIGDDFHESVVLTTPADIADILKRMTQRIFVSYTLEQFVENNFMSDEQLLLMTAEEQLEEAHLQTLKANRTLGWSVATCMLAVVIFLLQLLLPAYRQTQDDYEAIILSLDNINSSMTTAVDRVEERMDTYTVMGQDMLQKADNAVYILDKQEKTLRRMQRDVAEMATANVD